MTLNKELMLVYIPQNLKHLTFMILSNIKIKILNVRLEY